MMRIIIWAEKKHRLLFIPLLLLLIMLGMAWGTSVVVRAGDTARCTPIYEVDTTEKAVAISFDASWGAEYTEQILDILDEHNIKTTFFLVNIWLEEYPEMAAEIAARGHEIGLHSVTHPEFTGLTDAQIKQELADNDALIQKTTGYKPCLFRPPFGDWDDRVVSIVNGCGYQCIQWSVDSLDWKDLSAADIVERVTKDLHAGDIILFHNNGLHTAEALPQVLDYLEQNGLTAVPVCELLLPGGGYTDINGIQRAGN